MDSRRISCVVDWRLFLFSRHSAAFCQSASRKPAIQTFGSGIPPIQGCYLERVAHNSVFRRLQFYCFPEVNGIPVSRSRHRIDPVENPSTYILVLGVKLFIVFIIFTFGVLLTFPYPVFAPIQKRPAPWLNLTLILGLIVIFLSALLRRL